jgi:hypothetical protein
MEHEMFLCPSERFTVQHTGLVSIKFLWHQYIKRRQKIFDLVRINNGHYKAVPTAQGISHTHYTIWHKYICA